MERIDVPSAPRLEVRDLRLVLALAAGGTTARAAELLHLTQPAVSRALLGAEDRLGVRLFDRTARGLAPTLAGRTVVEGAERLLVELADLELRVRAPVAPPARVRVVCECYTAYRWMPSAVRGMRDALPGLDVAIALEHTGDPVAALVAGDVDVALLTTGAVPRGVEAIEERPLFHDEVVFVVAATHPLAARRTIGRADLRRHTLFTGNAPAAETQWFMTKVFGSSRPRIRVDRLPLTEAILDVARAGLGVAILSEWIAAPHLDAGDLVAKRLAGAPLRRPWRIAWRRESRGPAERLAAVLGAAVPHARLVG